MRGDQVEELYDTCRIDAFVATKAPFCLMLGIAQINQRDREILFLEPLIFEFLQSRPRRVVNEFLKAACRRAIERPGRTWTSILSNRNQGQTGDKKDARADRKKSFPFHLFPFQDALSDELQQPLNRLFQRQKPARKQGLLK